MNSAKKLYFAYGSNMNQARLVMRVGAVKKLGTLTLRGYRLLFDTGFQETGIYANIEKTGRDEDFVEGVLYELSSKQIRMLDRYEMLYNRVLERTGRKDINIYICINKACKIVSQYRKPNDEYLNYVLQGAKENNLTSTYEKIYKMISPAKVSGFA